MVLNFPSSPAVGALHNASNGLAYAFDGVKWTSQGSFNTGTVNVLKLDSIASSFNGSLKTFNLKVNNITVKPVNDQAVLISVNNVVLEPTVAYSINVNTGQITFTTAPTGGHAFFGILYSRIPVIDSITNPIQLSNGDKGDITVTNAGAVNEAFTIDAGVISTDKIADDAVTADKLANSINSAIAANTAKISNATHTGDVTGSTSLSIANDAVITSKIADDAVTSAKIAPNAITSSHIAADTVIAADIAANAITASELADNAVDTAAIVDNAVTGAKIADNLDIPDSNKIRFGTGNDLEIFHGGTNSLIRNNTGGGILFIQGNGDAGKYVALQPKPSEDGIVIKPDAETELYYDNNKKFQTSSTGITVLGTAPSLKFQDTTTGHQDFTMAADANDFIISDANNGDRFRLNANGSISSYGFFANIGTVYGSTGLATNGNIIISDDNDKLQIGASQDLEIYHSGSHSYIENSTNFLFIHSNSLALRSLSQEMFIDCSLDGSVDLYYDNVKRFETTSTGATISGNLELSSTYPSLTWTDTNHNSDYRITNNDGQLIIYDITNSAHRLNVNADGNIQIPNDNAVLQLGASQDLEIVHTGSQSTIQSKNVDNLTVRQQYAGGYLFLHGDNLHLRSQSTNELYLAGNNNNDVKLYFDNSVKFQTTSTGNLFLGSIKGADNADLILGNSDDFQLVHTGTYSNIYNATGDLDISSDVTRLKNGNRTENFAAFINNGQAELYYDNSKKFETTSTGIKISSGGQGLDDMLHLNAGGNSNGHGSKISFSRAGFLRAEIHAVKAETANNETDLVFRTTDAGSLYDALKIIGDTGNIQIPTDNAKLEIGASQDLRIYHDGNNSVIDNNTGDLYIQSEGSIFIQGSNNENVIKYNANGAVELYYDDSKKLETTSLGVAITGTTNSKLSAANGTLVLESTNNDVLVEASDDFIVKVQTSETGINAIGNGGVELYYDNSKKFNTDSGGAQVFGVLRFDDGNSSTNHLNFGNSADLKIYHDGGTSFISNTTGDLRLTSDNNLILRSADQTENYLVATRNSDVELFFDGSKKFETLSDGVNITGTLKVNGSAISTGGLGNVVEDTTPQLGGDLQSNGNDIDFADNDKAIFGTNGDFEIFHDGNHTNLFEKGTGNLALMTNGGELQLAHNDNAGTFEHLVRCIVNNQVELYFDGNVKLQTASHGTLVPANNDIRFTNGTWTGNATKIQLHDNRFYIQGGSATENIVLRSNAGNDRWYMNADGDFYPSFDNAEDLGQTDKRIRNIFVSSGIFLGGTGNDNHLNHYEEGTWTPTLEFGGATTNITYSSMRGGSYTRIGRQVTVNFGFTLTSKGSASGDATIAGLPFDIEDLLSSSTAEASGVSAFWNNIATNSANIVFVAMGGTSELEIRNTVGAEDDTDTLVNGDFENNTAIRGSITYFTAT